MATACESWVACRTCHGMSTERPTTWSGLDASQCSCDRYATRLGCVYQIKLRHLLYFFKEIGPLMSNLGIIIDLLNHITAAVFESSSH